MLIVEIWKNTEKYKEENTNPYDHNTWIYFLLIFSL